MLFRQTEVKCLIERIKRGAAAHLASGEAQDESSGPSIFLMKGRNARPNNSRKLQIMCFVSEDERPKQRRFFMSLLTWWLSVSGRNFGRV